jgi:hypothetical protein
LTADTLQWFFSTPGLAQQGPFKDNDVWRNEYRVGQAVEVNPGVNPGLKNIDWIQCVVTENSPGGVMRVNCQPFDGQSYYAGSRIIHGETDIVPLPAAVPMRARQGDWVEVQSQADFKWQRMQVMAVGNGRAIVLHEWDKEGTSTRFAIAKFTRGGSAPPPPPVMPASLPGTCWSLMGITNRGEPVRESSNPPDAASTKAGTWGILRYGGSRIAGRYRIQGNTLTMVYDEGQPYGTYRMEWQPQHGRLEPVSGDTTTRLKFRKPIAY